MTATTAVLVVCTGNICRSPYIEFRLRDALDSRGRAAVEVFSAGSSAVIGHGISTPLASRLQGLGIDPTGHRGHQLTASDVSRADLILTATRDHRRAVTTLDPDALGRTFTLRQFVRLLGAAPADVDPSIGALIEAANASRGRAGASTSEDDIEDPWRRSRRVYARAAKTMDEAVDALTDRLIR